VETLDSVAPAEERVAKGKAAAAIVIPRDLSQGIDAYTPTSIEVIVDPAQPESTSIVTGIMNEVVGEVTIWGEVQYGIRNVFNESGVLANASPEQRRAVEAQSLGVIMTRLNELRRTPAIAVQSEDLEGIPVSTQFAGYFAYLFPGLAVMFIFFAVSTVASGLLSERETGTLRRLMASPIPRSAIIGGKMLAYILLACAQAVILLGVARIAFAMPLGRSLLGLVLVTLATALTSTTLGVMLATLCKNSKQADNLGTLLGFVLGGLGGTIAASPTPIFRSPGFMGMLSKLTPQAHAVDGFYSLMAENASLAQVLPQVGILLLMSGAFFAVAVRRLRFE
jgi:ABC-2 type transport system permease protein